MCKCCRLLCSGCYRSDAKKKDEKDRSKGSSEQWIKSSTLNEFDRLDTKQMYTKTQLEVIEEKKLPKVRIRFESPLKAKDDKPLSHKLRLEERGYVLKSQTPIGKDVSEKPLLSTVAPVGEGPFSQVFEGQRMSDRALVAVKVMKNKELADSSSLFRTLAEEVELINSESIVSNLIRYFGLFIYDSKLSYIVMELTDTQTLYDKLKTSSAPFSERDSQIYFFQICSAVNYLHSHRIAHRDLKLENVLLCRSTNGNQLLKVSDYCINRMASKSDKVIVYIRDAKSLTYMSPQILKFYAKHLHKKYKRSERLIKQFDPLRGDVWALGVCLYYMLMKAPPYGLPPNTVRMDRDSGYKTRFKYLTECLDKCHKRLDLSHNVNTIVSNECKEILIKLLEPKANRRVNLFMVTRHIWVRSVSQMHNKLN